MSFPAAVQSAIFYYIACTPCSQMRHRHKARQKAKKDREEKLRIETEQPGLYTHPSPYNTNPYWAEEITMGPHLPKKAAAKNTSQRGLTSAGKDSTTTPTLTAASTNAESSSPTAIPEEERRLSGDDWNKRRYQREDEELWGHELSRMGHKLMDGIVKAGSSAGRLIEEKLGREKLGIEKTITDEDRYSFYQTPRNPPVNEYHPPIVGSKPPHKDAFKWMLQPPPPAKLMEGKIPVSRTASSHSMASKRTVGAEEPALGRMIHERLMQGKLRKGETPSESELIDSLIGTRSRRTTVSSRTRSARSRSLSFESEDYSSDGELERRIRRRTRRIASTPEDTEEDEGVALPRSSDSLGHLAHNVRAAQRPRLETIASSNSGSTRRPLKSRPNGSRPNLISKVSGNTVPTVKTGENHSITQSEVGTPVQPTP